MVALPALHAYIRVVRRFPVSRLDLHTIEFKIFGVFLTVQLHIVTYKLQALRSASPARTTVASPTRTTVPTSLHH